LRLRARSPRRWVTIRPGGLREMHWHPNVSESQYWIKGKGPIALPKVFL
jgi:oxalate decarboxylase/phosphoglucose isomerase-like protein (cupin superfamily)